LDEEADMSHKGIKSENHRDETRSRPGENRKRFVKSTEFRREPLTVEEAERLMKACETGYERLIIWTLLDTGLRVSELVSLRRDSVEWQAHRIHIVGKGGRKRVVPLTDRVRALLESYFALNDRIRMSARGVQFLVRRVAERAGITKPVTPHVLRHTFAVRSLQRGVSLPSLQKVLGHRNLTTTAIYLNLSPEEAVREYIEKF